MAASSSSTFQNAMSRTSKSNTTSKGFDASKWYKPELVVSLLPCLRVARNAPNGPARPAGG
eukprot:4393838-Amphidinium_carterae.2